MTIPKTLNALYVNADLIGCHSLNAPFGTDFLTAYDRTINQSFVGPSTVHFDGLVNTTSLTDVNIEVDRFYTQTTSSISIPSNSQINGVLTINNTLNISVPGTSGGNAVTIYEPSLASGNSITTTINALSLRYTEPSTGVVTMGSSSITMPSSSVNIAPELRIGNVTVKTYKTKTVTLPSNIFLDTSEYGNVIEITLYINNVTNLTGYADVTRISPWTVGQNKLTNPSSYPALQVASTRNATALWHTSDAAGIPVSEVQNIPPTTLNGKLTFYKVGVSSLGVEYWSFTGQTLSIDVPNQISGYLEFPSADILQGFSISMNQGSLTMVSLSI